MVFSQRDCPLPKSELIQTNNKLVFSYENKSDRKFLRKLSNDRHKEIPSNFSLFRNIQKVMFYRQESELLAVEGNTDIILFSKL